MVDMVEDASPAESAWAQAHWKLILGALFTGVVLFGFQQTSITPSMPVVQRDLGASEEWTTWLLSGYFIIASVLSVFLAKLADQSGKRRVLVGALTAFLLGSIGAALAPSIEVLVICRLVQGIGGVVFPVSNAILRDHLPEGYVHTGIGILAGGFGIGSLGGYGLGGLITQYVGWRWIFWVGAVGVTVATAFIASVIPKSPRRPHRRLDLPGALLFGATVSGVIVAVTEGPEAGWTHPFTLSMFGVSVVAALAWVARELHTPEPLMDLHMLSSRSILFTNLASVFSGYAAIGASVLLTFMLQGSTGSTFMAFGLSAGPLLTGLVLVPRAIGQSFGGPVSTPLIRRFGQVSVFVAGMLLVTVAMVGLALWRSELWMIVIELVVLGVGFGVAVTMMNGIVTLTVDETETSVAVSINSVLRRVGGAIGAQVGIALVATVTAGSGEDGLAAGGFTLAFLVAGAVAVVGALCSLFGAPSRRDASREVTVLVSDPSVTA